MGVRERRRAARLTGSPSGRATARRDAADGRARRAAYDPTTFAERNVYYLPAVMWHQVRARLGDDEFFRLVREWPATHDNENAGYDESPPGGRSSPARS